MPSAITYLRWWSRYWEETFQVLEIHRQHQKGEQVPHIKDAEVDALPQTSLEAFVLPADAIDDSKQVIEDLEPPQAFVEGVEETHSLSPQDNKRNREYLIRRSARANPNQEHMDAVVAYDCEQHRINFLHLYQ